MKGKKANRTNQPMAQNNTIDSMIIAIDNYMACRKNSFGYNDVAKVQSSYGSQPFVRISMF
jgi:hypothetical protein